MPNRIPRATHVYSDSTPSDRAPDRPVSNRMSKERNSSYTRLKHLSEQEQAAKAQRDVEARRKLATLLCRWQGIDPDTDPPHDAGLICTAWEFHDLAAMLGLDGGAP